MELGRLVHALKATYLIHSRKIRSLQILPIDCISKPSFSDDATDINESWIFVNVNAHRFNCNVTYCHTDTIISTVLRRHNEHIARRRTLQHAPKRKFTIQHITNECMHIVIVHSTIIPVTNGNYIHCAINNRCTLPWCLRRTTRTDCWTVQMTSRYPCRPHGHPSGMSPSWRCRHSSKQWWSTPCPGHRTQWRRHQRLQVDKQWTTNVRWFTCSIAILQLTISL